MIATDASQASQAGQQVYASGGNVIDSIVAASFVLCVVRPQSTGLGGGGFMLVYMNKQIQSYDFRERAPLAAHSNMYRKADGRLDAKGSLVGMRAVAVPGNIAGLVSVHKKYGKLKLAQVLAPAIQLAMHGFVVYPDLEQAIKNAWPDMDENMRSVFGPDKKKLKQGDFLVQKDLGRSLRLVAKQGSAPFYRGVVAQALAQFMKKQGGLLRLPDLRRYRVLSAPPLWVGYRNWRIATMPPPSSGIYLLHMFKLLERFPLKQLYANKRQEYYMRLVQAMHSAYRERSLNGGDPRFSPVPIPMQRLLNPTSLPHESKPSVPHQYQHQQAYPNHSNHYETTHISVMDAEGNAAVSTQSINYRFGARVMLPGWGIILNDTMDDFSMAPGQANVYGLIGGRANAIASGKTPLSSMSPTLIFDKEGTQVQLAIGAPGGSQIPTSILQSAINTLDLGLHPFVAVASGRVHHQYRPLSVIAEPQAGIKKKLVSNLLEKTLPKLVLQEKKFYAKVFQVFRTERGEFIGVSDPRGNGSPAGL